MIFHIIGWLFISIGAVCIIGNMIYNIGRGYWVKSIDGYYFGGILVLIGIIAGSAAAHDFNNLPNQYCSSHLSECVLVNDSQDTLCTTGRYDAVDKGCYTIVTHRLIREAIVFSVPAKNYRLKNDCEKNPREDESCLCMDYYFITQQPISPEGQAVLVKDKCYNARERSWQEVCEYKNMTYSKVYINSAKLAEFSGSEFEVCIDEKRSDTKSGEGESG